MIVQINVILAIILISQPNNVPNVKIIAIIVIVQPNVIIVLTIWFLLVQIVLLSVTMAIGSNQMILKAIGAKNAPIIVSPVIPILSVPNVSITME